MIVVTTRLYLPKWQKLQRLSASVEREQSALSPCKLLFGKANRLNCSFLTIVAYTTYQFAHSKCPNGSLQHIIFVANNDVAWEDLLIDLPVLQRLC